MADAAAGTVQPASFFSRAVGFVTGGGGAEGGGGGAEGGGGPDGPEGALGGGAAAGARAAEDHARADERTREIKAARVSAKTLRAYSSEMAKFIIFLLGRYGEGDARNVLPRGWRVYLNGLVEEHGVDMADVRRWATPGDLNPSPASEAGGEELGGREGEEGGGEGEGGDNPGAPVGSVAEELLESAKHTQFKKLCWKLGEDLHRRAGGAWPQGGEELQLRELEDVHFSEFFLQKGAVPQVWGKLTRNTMHGMLNALYNVFLNHNLGSEWGVLRKEVGDIVNGLTKRLAQARTEEGQGEVKVGKDPMPLEAYMKFNL